MRLADTEIFLYNSLKKKVMLFEPLEADRVTVYVCGPTVYDRVHVGNARSLIVFDVLIRLLRQKYSNVVYVRNMTDIDDKIIARATSLGISEKELTDEMASFFHQDIEPLNLVTPTSEPRATDYIEKMITFIKGLLNVGAAYEAQGHVLFSVKSVEEGYGLLSGRKIEDQRAGARVEVEAYKREPADFVLWKPSPEESIGWESPWGYGRPGWHLECSVMSEDHLGNRFDIHGGGQDLLFPHHENERAQNMAYHQRKQGCARFWMHNGFLTFCGHKMSKSVGNLRLLWEIVDQWSGEVLRYMILSAHYREPLAFSSEALWEAQRVLVRFYDGLDRSGVDLDEARGSLKDERVEPGVDFVAALAYDLNTSKALAALHGELDRLNGLIRQKAPLAQRQASVRTLLSGGEMLGLLQKEPAFYLKAIPAQSDWTRETIEAFIHERTMAKQRKDFARADEIRQELFEAGIALRDTPGSTDWFRHYESPPKKD